MLRQGFGDHTELQKHGAGRDSFPALKDMKKQQSVLIKTPSLSKRWLLVVYLVQQRALFHILNRFDEALNCYEIAISLYPIHADHGTARTCVI